MQLIKTVLTNLAGAHLGIIHVEFSQMLISDLGYVFRRLPYIIQCKIVTQVFPRDII